MQNNIIQGSDEWRAARQSKIGASEIFSLVLHYCKKELEAMTFDLKEEKSFRTVQELFLKIKFGAELSAIDPIHSEFGNGMEPYVISLLKKELKDLEIQRSKEFFTNEKLHPLAACSPDGFAEICYNCNLVDFDNTCEINENWGEGAIELKTANYFANFGSEKGSRLNYIFQLQFQLMVLELKWGVLAVQIPNKKEYDEPFFKGKVLREMEIVEAQQADVDLSFAGCYDLKYYIYPELPAFQAMIMKALNCFQHDLDAYDAGDQSAFPRNSEDLLGLEREKQLWGQLWPEHYGITELSGDDELDKLFNERFHLQVAQMFAKQDLDKVTNEIYQRVKARGFDKFCQILGTSNRMSFIKNGQVRFYKLKEAN